MRIQHCMLDDADMPRANSHLSPFEFDKLGCKIVVAPFRHIKVVACSRSCGYILFPILIQTASTVITRHDSSKVQHPHGRARPCTRVYETSFSKAKARSIIRLLQHILWNDKAYLNYFFEPAKVIVHQVMQMPRASKMSETQEAMHRGLVRDILDESCPKMLRQGRVTTKQPIINITDDCNMHRPPTFGDWIM